MSDLENVKKLFPSLMNYRKLNDTIGFGVPDCDELEKYSTEIQDIKNICLIITGAREYLDFIPFENLPDNEMCTALILWVYDFLNVQFKNGAYYSKIGKVIDLIRPIWIKSSKWESCDIRTYIGSENMVQNMKSLYDYATDLPTIEHHLQNANFKCSNNFSTYIQDNIRILKELNDQCKDNVTDKYCIVFNDVFVRALFEKISNLKCNVVDNTVNIQKTVKKYKVSQGLHEQINMDTYNSNAFIKSMKITFPLFGLILIFSILYIVKIKIYTPAGTWIKKKIKVYKILWYRLYNIFKNGTLGHIYENQSLHTVRNELNDSNSPVSYNLFYY
ncbi:variable surface protein [Plasmodium gonderi]|uniref:Variable surface protein n=1 Tax=Plasmodium gonderi TaxID=77519 RepID=A0A1Y1JT89_PLAGO|nr:variable surface protein [Plasmodium gonderi]GAW83992.1 variable surface protein [Plasmodium gonderi]